MAIINQTVLSTTNTAQIAATLPAAGSGSVDGIPVTALGLTVNVNIAGGASVSNVSVFWAPSGTSSPTAAMALQNATPLPIGTPLEFNGLLCSPGDVIFINPGAANDIAVTVSATPR